MRMHRPTYITGRLGLALFAASAALLGGCGGNGGDSAAVGTLKLESTPPGATILINGQDTTKTTPVDIVREVAQAGSQLTVVMRLAGYDDASQTVQLGPNQTVTVALTLQASRPPSIPPHTITGRVLLAAQGGGTTPATDATVTATETTSGEVFAAVLQSSGDTAGTYYIFAPAGTYDVVASKTGYQSQTKQVTIISGEDRKTGVDFSLVP